MIICSFCSSARALDEYASIRSKASKATEEDEMMDPRLEVIVERMLDKYDNPHYLQCSPQYLANPVLTSIPQMLFSGVLLMENINRPWVWPWNAGDLINWRKQSLDVTIFMELFLTA